MNYIVKGLNTHEILVALSTHINEAVLHVHFDKVDDRNHKSLTALVHVLEDSGYGDIAQIVEDQTGYLLIDNPVLATKINDFINEHSAAIYSSITYKGLQNTEAVALIHKEFPKEKETHHIGQTLKLKTH